MSRRNSRRNKNYLNHHRVNVGHCHDVVDLGIVVLDSFLLVLKLFPGCLPLLFRQVLVNLTKRMLTCLSVDYPKRSNRKAARASFHGSNVSTCLFSILISFI